MNKSGEMPAGNRTSIRLAEYYPMIADTLRQGGSVVLPVTGTSMKPTIVGGRDQVTLIQAEKPLRKYDLPLYRRNNGQFVLHRIISVEKDGTYTCCGDHQWKPEPGIRPEQIIGIVSEFVRKGKRYSVQNAGYQRYVRLWVIILPLRRICLHFGFWLSTCIRKLTRKK